MIRSLPPLVEKHRKQLRVNMNTCLNADNADELIAFMKFVYEELPVDGQYLQLIRGSVMDPSLKQIPLEKLARSMPTPDGCTTVMPNACSDHCRGRAAKP
jgi:hypothetical protein